MAKPRPSFIPQPISDVDSAQLGGGTLNVEKGRSWEAVQGTGRDMVQASGCVCVARHANEARGVRWARHLSMHEYSE